MTFHVVQPPKDEAAFVPLGKELLEASRAFGLTLDAEQFLYQWASGTRVLVERNAERRIVSMAIVAMGKRWTHSDTTATVLHLEGNKEELLEFVKQIATGFGATELFVQSPLPVQKQGYREYTVRGYELQ
jgi:hypothetical protein